MPEKKHARAFWNVATAEVFASSTGRRKVVITVGGYGNAHVRGWNSFFVAREDVPTLLAYDAVPAQRETLSGKMVVVKLRLLWCDSAHRDGVLQMTEEGRGVEDFVIAGWFYGFEQAIRDCIT